MARRTHVPKFGNWDANDHMPYTVVFDHARQDRGRPINPNDPAENPSMFPAGRGGGAGAPGARRYNHPNDPEESAERADPRPQQERPTAQQQQGIVREGSGSGSGGGAGRAGSQQQLSQRATGAEERRRNSSGQSNLPSRGPSADLNKRPSRDSAFDRSVESPSTSFSADQSPSHPQSGSRFDGSAGGRGAGTRLGGNNSPAYDPTRRRSTGEDGGQGFAPATPNTRSRLGNGKTTREEPPTRGPSAALPMFGAWDAQDPGSGDGFTVIFSNAINEKKHGVPGNLNAKTPDRENKDLYENSSNQGYQKRHSRHTSWFCCLSPKVRA